MVKFSYRKGVYMQVSAVSANSSKTVFNTKANNRAGDENTGISFSNLDSFSKNNKINDRNKLFDSINEWKYFCHSQIEKGNLDVIV